MRTRLRRLGFGLSTVLGLRPRGFFIPYRYADRLPGPVSRHGYDALQPLFSAAEGDFRSLLALIDEHAASLDALSGGMPPEPRWRQDWFPRLDGAAAYVMVRTRRPRRIVEVGSGHSTRFLARAARDGGLDVAITAIDPAPRADIAGLGVEILRMPVQEAGMAPFERLAAGDILFVDSSHILMPGTDVDLLLNEVMARLPGGVMVHVHDIFLPDGYPPEWTWRGYNEQLGIAPLLHGGGYRLLWASHYVASRMAAEVAASHAGRIELLPGAREASLWLEKL